MAFVKLVSKGHKEYQGESFSKPLAKSNGTVWAPEDTGYHELLDGDGLVVSTEPLTHTVDDLALEFFVPSSATAAITGNHKLLVHLTNSVNAEKDDVIAEYQIIYSERKA